MPMQDPSHPGQIILHECIEPLGLTVEEAADALGVGVSELSLVLAGGAGLTTEMAIRVSKVFGGSSRSWYQMQAAYDISVADKCAGSVGVGRALWPNLRQEAETLPDGYAHQQSVYEYVRSTDTLSVPVGDIVHLYTGMMAAAQVFARQIRALESIGTNVVVGINGPSARDWSAFIGALPVVRDLGRLLRTVSGDVSLDTRAYGFLYYGHSGTVVIPFAKVVLLRRGFAGAGSVVNSLFDEMEKLQVADAIGEESFTDLDDLASAEHIAETWEAFIQLQPDIAAVMEAQTDEVADPQNTDETTEAPFPDTISPGFDQLFEEITQFLQSGPIPDLSESSLR